MRRTIPLLLVLVAAALALGVTSPWAGAAPPAAFDWSMPERFGIDTDGDDVIDERTDAAYVDPATWPVDFDACDDDGNPHPGATYSWDFGDGTPVSTPSASCEITHGYAEIDTPYQVTLTVADGSGSSTTTQTILPRDHVIVSLGDSAASGEGNPDHLEPALRSRSFTSAGFSHTWNDEQCHRSALAGPAQAAIRLEQRDPHSSVTFVHLACSGARITRGIIAPYQGLVNEADPRLDCDDPQSPFYIRYPDSKLDAPRPTDPDCLPPQVDQLASIIGDRPIDAITVSGGINDVFFSKVAFACLLTDDCSTMPSDQMAGPDGQAQTAEQFLGVRFGQLQARYAALADELMQLPLRQADPAAGIAAGRVFLTTYPNPETDDDGSVCHTDEVARVASMPQWLKDALDDLLAPAGMDSDAGIMTQHEWGWAAQAIVQQLKNHIVDAVATANAEYPGRFAAITEPTSAFATHGYCANDTWVRDIPTSFLYQRDPEGSFHPNRAGHFHGYALPIEDHLAPHLGISAPELPPHVPGDIETYEAINQDLAQLMEVLSRIDFVEELERLLPDDTRKKREKDGDRDLDLARLPQLIRDAVGGLRDKLVAEGTPKALSELDAWFDDALDAEVGPLDLDVTGTITPHANTERYELLLDATLAGPLTEMRLDTGGLRLDGPDVHTEVTFDFRFVVEPERPRDRVYLLPADDNGIRVSLSAEQTVPPGEPRDALLGVVDVAVHGPANGKAVDFASAIDIEPRDPNANGEISVDELVGRAFTGAFSVACDPSSHLALDLHLRAGLPGLTGEIGSLALDDANLCDGLTTPTVTFADPDLSALHNLGPHDVIDAVIALAQALEVVQQRSDVDLPFADGALSDVVDLSRRVREFLTDAGWTDPDDPLSPLPMDEAEERAVSLADLVTGLEAELGLPAGTFDLRYEPAATRFVLDVGFDVGADAVTLAADTGLLERVGVLDAGGASVTAGADATIDLGIALDVSSDPEGTPTADLRTVADRLLVHTGSGVAVDATAAVEVDATARIGPLPVQVTLDDGAGGARQLLTRSDPSAPMFRVGVAGPGDWVSLADLLSADAERASVTADVNARLAPVPVHVVARLRDGGPVLGTGTVTVSWADLGQLSGPDGPQVTGDAAFNRDLLRFADAANDPWRMVALLLGGVRDAADGIVETAREHEELARSLPVVGAGYDDVVAAFAGVSDAADALLAAHQELTIPNLEGAIEDALVDTLGFTEAEAAEAVALDLDRTTPRTALVLHLDLCAASTDEPGCGDAPEVGGRLVVDADGLGLVGVDGEATFGLDYLARASIDLALELPAVVAGTSESPDPTVAPDEAPMGLFVLGGTGVEVELDAGIDLNQSATGAFRVHVGPYEGSLGIRGTRNGAPFVDAAAGGVRARLVVDTGRPAGERLTPAQWLDAVADGLADGIVDPAFADATCPNQPGDLDACLTLPVYLRTAAGDVTTADGRRWQRMGTGSITFTAGNLLDPATWDADVPQDVTDAIVDRALSVTSLIEGVRALLAEARAAMDGAATGQSIPVVGEALDAGSAAVEKLDQAAEKLAQLAAAVEGKATAGALRTAVTSFLTNNLGTGSGGLNILVGTPEVVVRCGDAVCADSAPILDVDDVAVRFSIGKGNQATTPTVSTGVPGLAVGTGAKASATVSWRLDVAVGVDRNGFYLEPANRDGRPAELTVDATASVPAAFDGTLAGLPVRLTEDAEPDLTVQLGADLLGTGKIRLAELVERGADVLDPTSTLLYARGCADLDLAFDVQLPVSNDPPTALPGLEGVIDLHADWNGCAGAGAPVDIREGLAPVATLAVRDVALDAGATLTDLIAPVIGNLQHVTMPLQPVVEDITSPIPVVSDLAGIVGEDEITWLDAFVAQQAMSGNDVSGLATVARLIDFVNGFDVTSQPNVTVPVVDHLAIDLEAARRRYADPDQAFQDLIANTPVVNDVMEDLESAGWTVETEIDEVAPEEEGAEFRFPVIEDPALLVQLLFGKDVDLAVFDAGPLRADASFDYAYGLPFAKVGIRGGAEVEGHFEVSYDTAGLRRMIAARPLALSSLGALVHGLGLNDLDAGGTDVPEIHLGANITAYAYGGVPGANIEARGGIRGYADANLRDPDGDGKLRYEEVAQRIADPLCLFDLDGRVEAFLEVSGQLGFLRATRQIVPPYVMLEFTNGQDGGCGLIGGGDPNDPEVPQGTQLELARQQGAGLSIYVGHSTDLQDGKYDDPDHPTDGPQHLVVVDHGDGRVTVRIGAASKTYGSRALPISEIFAAMGQGDDSFEMVRRVAPGNTTPRAPVKAHVQLGPGDDTAIGGPANDAINGEAGNDVLRGGDGADIVIGGDGNDAIYGEAGHDSGLHGFAGDDYIEGGDGSDTIKPGDGRDVSFGGPGNDGISDAQQGNSYMATGPDVMDGGPGNDGLVGSLHGDLLIGGAEETPTNSPEDHIMGRSGDDCIVGEDDVAPDLAELEGPVCQGLVQIDGPGGSDTGFGEAGNDTIVTGGGYSETLIGGDGDDWLDGGPGTNKIEGDGGHDVLLGREANDTLNGGAGNDVLYGNEGVDSMSGMAGDDRVYAEGGNDTSVYAGDGNDVMDGGPGNDALRSGNGNDVVYGDAGTDTVIGEAGDDRVEGDADADAVYGDSTTLAGSSTDGHDVMGGGPGNDNLVAGRGDDTLSAGDGNDTADAGPGNDDVDGGPGSDRLHGKAGDDVVDGGPGNDAVVGDVVTLSEATNPPTTWPNGALKLNPTFDATVAGDDVLVGGGGEDFGYDTELTPPSAAPQSSARLTVTDPPDHGTAGTVATSFSYRATTGYQGSDAVGYRLNHSTTGALMGEGRVVITYFTNRAPVAADDRVATGQGRPVSGDVLANDDDPDGDPLVVTSLGGPTAHGTVDLDPDGGFTYTPDPAFAGTDGFDYTVADPRGETDTAHVTVTVRPDVAGPGVDCDRPGTRWFGGEATVECGATDGGSGLADPAQASFGLTTALGDGNEGPYPLDPPAVCDVAGNCTDLAPFDVLVDRKGPTVTSATDGQRFPAGTSEIVADVQCTDAGSGMAFEDCPDHGRKLDTSPGDHTFTATGTDRVGNATTATFSYTVDSSPVVAVSVGDASVVEGTGGGRRVYVPVTLSAPATEVVTVVVDVKDGTATLGTNGLAGGDARARRDARVLAASTISFEPGPDGRTPVQRFVVVEVAGDRLVEGTESLGVALSEPKGAVLGRSEGTVTVLDDDPPMIGVAASVGDVTIVEGDDGGRVARVAVTLSEAAAQDVSVTVVATEGPILVGQRVTFTAGQVTRYVDVPVAADTVVERDEVVPVRLMSRDVLVHRADATITVVDDDAMPPA